MSGFQGTFYMTKSVVTRMDTPKQDWTRYDINTTETLLQTVKEV